MGCRCSPYMDSSGVAPVPSAARPDATTAAISAALHSGCSAAGAVHRHVHAPSARRTGHGIDGNATDSAYRHAIDQPPSAVAPNRSIISSSNTLGCGPGGGSRRAMSSTGGRNDAIARLMRAQGANARSEAIEGKWLHRWQSLCPR